MKLVALRRRALQLSALYSVLAQFPDYADARALPENARNANPGADVEDTRLAHPLRSAAAVMPDDGHLLDLFYDWTPDEATRRRILVETPARLFGG